MHACTVTHTCMLTLAGSITLCASAEGWVAPSPKDDGKKKKKKGKGDGAAPAAQAAPADGAADEELDPEKAAKKVGLKIKLWQAQQQQRQMFNHLPCCPGFEIAARRTHIRQAGRARSPGVRLHWCLLPCWLTQHTFISCACSLHAAGSLSHGALHSALCPTA